MEMSIKISISDKIYDDMKIKSKNNDINLKSAVNITVKLAIKQFNSDSYIKSPNKLEYSNDNTVRSFKINKEYYIELSRIADLFDINKKDLFKIIILGYFDDTIDLTNILKI